LFTWWCPPKYVSIVLIVSKLNAVYLYFMFTMTDLATFFVSNLKQKLLQAHCKITMTSFTCTVGCAPKWVLNLFTSITTMLKFGCTFCLVRIKQCHVNELYVLFLGCEIFLVVFKWQRTKAHHAVKIVVIFS
jgi:hypothetical protein